MGHLTRMTSTDHTKAPGQALHETLDGYFERLKSVACVTIVDELMRSLADFLDIAAASDRLGEFRKTCQNHPLHGLLLEDPFTARGFCRRRGQAADGVMLDYIYRPRYLPLSEIGGAVHFVTTNLGAAQSIGRRRDRFAKAIAQTMRRVRKARILSLANAYLRELDVARGLIDRRDCQIFAVDTQTPALREAVNANPDFNVTPLQQPAWHFVRQQSKATFDLIYSATLLDHLTDCEASDLLARLIGQLNPGGRLIVGNYAPETYARGYMEGMMGWRVVYRNERDLERLADSGGLNQSRIYRDAPGDIIYLEVRSPRAG